MYDPPPNTFSDITLISKTYDLYRSLQKLILKFAKPYRYGLGEKIQTTTLAIIAATTRALHARQPLKEPYLLELIAQIQTLQIFIRLAFDEKLIQETNYFSLSAQAEELQRMAIGWLKSVRQH